MSQDISRMSPGDMTNQNNFSLERKLTAKMSATFNVFRYSALAGGVVYGFVNRIYLQSSQEKKDFNNQWNKEEKLINKARKQYAKLTAPPKVEVQAGSINWEDPNLDIGQVIDQWLAKLD